MPGAAAMAQALMLLRRANSPLYSVLVEEIFSQDPINSERSLGLVTLLLCTRAHLRNEPCTRAQGA